VARRNTANSAAMCDKELTARQAALPGSATVTLEQLCSHSRKPPTAHEFRGGRLRHTSSIVKIATSRRKTASCSLGADPRNPFRRIGPPTLCWRRFQECFGSAPVDGVFALKLNKQPDRPPPERHESRPLSRTPVNVLRLSRLMQKRYAWITRGAQNTSSILFPQQALDASNSGIQTVDRPRATNSRASCATAGKYGTHRGEFGLYTPVRRPIQPSSDSTLHRLSRSASIASWRPSGNRPRHRTCSEFCAPSGCRERDDFEAGWVLERALPA